MAFLFGPNPIGFVLRLLSLPLAIPLIFLANAATNNLDPSGGQHSFLSALGEYITGDQDDKVKGVFRVVAPASSFTLSATARGVLSLITGAASVLNITTFGIGGSWAIYISAALAFFAYIGIPPVTGNAFQILLLKIFPAQWVQTVHGVLGAAMAAVSILVTQAKFSTALTALILGVVAELGALGFGPTGTAPITAASLPKK